MAYFDGVRVPIHPECLACRYYDDQQEWINNGCSPCQCCELWNIIDESDVKLIKLLHEKE